MTHGIMTADKDFFIEGVDEKGALYCHSRFGTYWMEWPETIEYNGKTYTWDGKIPVREQLQNHYATSAVYQPVELS